MDALVYDRVNIVKSTNSIEAGMAYRATGDAFVLAKSQQGSAPIAATKIAPEQLDSLVSPIALYPDPLLAQTLAAATYPLEIIQIQQWLQKNKNLKEKELADAVEKQSWGSKCTSARGTTRRSQSPGRSFQSGQLFQSRKTRAQYVNF